MSFVDLSVLFVTESIWIIGLFGLLASFKHLQMGVLFDNKKLREIYNASKDYVLLALFNEYSDENDYIKNYVVFLKSARSKK
jgi:hypothetical protein